MDLFPDNTILVVNTMLPPQQIFPPETCQPYSRCISQKLRQCWVNKNAQVLTWRLVANHQLVGTRIKTKVHLSAWHLDLCPSVLLHDTNLSARRVAAISPGMSSQLLIYPFCLSVLHICPQTPSLHLSDWNVAAVHFCTHALLQPDNITQNNISYYILDNHFCR